MPSVRSPIVAVSTLLVLAAGYLLAAPQWQNAQTSETAAGNTGTRLTEPITDEEIAALRLQCERRAAVIRQQFPRRFRVIVQRPFVIVGDYDESQLRDVYARTILPTARGLHSQYFARHPMAPITILLISNTRAYQAYARATQRSTYANYYGYYRRDQQLIVVNAATGTGTLAHELTHALTDTDFPEMPQWFNEGFAALHEELEVLRPSGHLRGLPNWRLRTVVAAWQRRNLQTLRTLITGIHLRPAQEQLDCAHARLVCLFLQDRGVLDEFYQRLRENIARDPSGAATFRQMFENREWSQIEAEFRIWLERTNELFLQQRPGLHSEPVAESPGREPKFLAHTVSDAQCSRLRPLSRSECIAHGVS